MKPYFLTGAGISLASGIPTFRGNDPEAVWSKAATETGTRRYFNKYPVESWKNYLDRFLKYGEATPNAAHELLVKIEKSCEKFTLVTQNVDGLHLKAGSSDPIEIHGAMRYVRCTRWPCPFAAPLGLIDFKASLFEAFLKEPSLENIPKCEACGNILRPHVLWFDESYDAHHEYRFADALERVEGSDQIIVLGSSMAVGIADHLIEAAEHVDIPVICVDPFQDRPPKKGVKLVKKDAVLFLKEYLRGLK